MPCLQALAQKTELLADTKGLEGLWTLRKDAQYFHNVKHNMRSFTEDTPMICAALQHPNKFLKVAQFFTQKEFVVPQHTLAGILANFWTPVVLLQGRASST